MKKKNYILIILAALIIVFVVFILLNHANNKKIQENNKINFINTEINNLSKKYNANTNWSNNNSTQTYTIDAQQKLTSNNPILIRGYIDDIFIDKGEEFLRIITNEYYLSNYIFNIKCDKSKCFKILLDISLRNAPNFLNEYAVVINVNNVYKNNIINNNTSNNIIIDGDYIDAVYIGDL